MKESKYIIIGGGLAGARAAFYLRQMDPDGRIIIFSEESYLPYDRPPLSKEILKGIKRLEDIYLYKEREFSENNIEIFLNTKVTELSLDEHAITTSTGDKFFFQKAFIATGGRPRLLPFEVFSTNEVYYLRNFNHAQKIKAKAQESRSVIIIGAGFIGMETASAFIEQGLKVSVIDINPWLWDRFLPENISHKFSEKFSEKGVRFYFSTSAQSIQGEKGKVRVQLSGNQILEADFICVGIGIDLNLELARNAGLKVDRGILVNDNMQTSHPDIFAGGDIIQFMDPYAGKYRVVEHWGHAEFSGLVAASAMSGNPYKYDLLNYAWTDLFDLHIDFGGEPSVAYNAIPYKLNEDLSGYVLYIHENKLKGYMGINPANKDIAILQKWIKKGVSLHTILPMIMDSESSLTELNKQLES